MKKKTCLVLLVLMAVTMLPLGSASAAVYRCIVNNVGTQSDGYVTLNLTDTAAAPAFTARNFIMPATGTYKKEMLAAALTAVANSMSADVNLSGTAAWSTVFGVKPVK